MYKASKGVLVSQVIEDIPKGHSGPPVLECKASKDVLVSQVLEVCVGFTELIYLDRISLACGASVLPSNLQLSIVAVSLATVKGRNLRRVVFRGVQYRSMVVNTDERQLFRRVQYQSKVLNIDERQLALDSILLLAHCGYNYIIGGPKKSCLSWCSIPIHGIGEYIRTTTLLRFRPLTCTLWL